ncbi:MAG: porin family protein [Prevotellaceae bacterium]|nr:porin family protein [Prevotellaceae bacterium]
MKKLLMALVATVIVASTEAREFGIGVNALYGTEIHNAGFGVKATLGLTGKLRLEASYDNYLKKKKDASDTKMFDANLNLHYVFSLPLVKKLKVYPIVGVTYTNWKIPAKASVASDIAEASDTRSATSEALNNQKDVKHNYVGANIGVGAQYKIVGPLWVNVDLKYQIIKKNSQFVPGIGLMLRI